jgi:hypothetical protein
MRDCDTPSNKKQAEITASYGFGRFIKVEKPS